MEIKITGKKENILFNRTEVTAEVVHPGEPTPKRSLVRQAVADAMKVPTDVVAVIQCKSQFGFKSICTAAVYKTSDDLKKHESKYVIGRETGHKTHHTKAAEAVAK
jgi:small subunit ribosomal protein S24e